MSATQPLTSRCEAILAPRLEQRILPGLERMNAALAALGHPERSLRSVLVLGTNGKGSTAAMLASVLRAHGLAVGLFTSPHLVRVEERIEVDGSPIGTGRLVGLLGSLASFPQLSYFETLATAAILEFAEQAVDVAVLEAGLGGRWDATNSFPPAVSLLTNVGTDHQSWLGATRQAIAAEKAAALRGREAIVAEWDDEVEGVIRAAADPATSLSLAAEWASVSGVRGPKSGVREVDFVVGEVRGCAELPLDGRHQQVNLTLALAGAAALAKHGDMPLLHRHAVVRGIESTVWPGRLDCRDFKGRNVLLDGAHNLEAVAALAAHLSRQRHADLRLLFSCLSDKPLAAMADILRPLVSGVTVCALDTPRAAPLEQLGAAFPGCTRVPGVREALATLPHGSTTLVTGSLRLVGDVLRQLEVTHE